MDLHRRTASSATSHVDVLVEMDDQLGYLVGDRFIVVSDLRGVRRSKTKKRTKEMLDEFLAGSPHMRQLAKAGHVTFSVQGNWIYFHTTIEGFKANGLGPPDRARAIESGNVDASPTEYSDTLKKPPKIVEGAERDDWASARFVENEQTIAQLKRKHGRPQKSTLLSIEKPQSTLQVSRSAP